MAFFGLANWLSFIHNGTVNALAVDSQQRSPLLPEVPTLSELGYGENLTRLYSASWRRPARRKRSSTSCATEFAAWATMPQFRQKRMIDVGLEPVFDTPEDFASFLKADRAASARIVRGSGMEPQ